MDILKVFINDKWPKSLVSTHQFPTGVLVGQAFFFDFHQVPGWSFAHITVISWKFGLRALRLFLLFGGLNRLTLHQAASLIMIGLIAMNQNKARCWKSNRLSFAYYIDERVSSTKLISPEWRRLYTGWLYFNFLLSTKGYERWFQA